MPSKLYKILAVERPVIASVDAGTEVGRVAVDAGAGVAIAPDESEPLVEAISRLFESPDTLVEMGRHGRSWVEEWVTPLVAAKRYEGAFQSLIEG